MSDTLYLGIDPGQAGGLAGLDGKGAVIVCLPMPDTRKQVYDCLYKIGFSFKRRVAAVEKVHSMPKQGVASTFKFGRGYGEVLGIVTALLFEVHEPTPQA